MNSPLGARTLFSNTLTLPYIILSATFVTNPSGARTLFSNTSILLYIILSTTSITNLLGVSTLFNSTLTYTVTVNIASPSLREK